MAFYQRVSIASYASAGIARGGMSVRPSVHLSHSGGHVRTVPSNVLVKFEVRKFDRSRTIDI